ARQDGVTQRELEQAWEVSRQRVSQVLSELEAHLASAPRRTEADRSIGSRSPARREGVPAGSGSAVHALSRKGRPVPRGAVRRNSGSYVSPSSRVSGRSFR